MRAIAVQAALGWVTYERVLGEFGGTGAESRRALLPLCCRRAWRNRHLAVAERLGRLVGGLRVVRDARATAAGRPPSRSGGSSVGTAAGASLAGSDRGCRWRSISAVRRASGRREREAMPWVARRRRIWRGDDLGTRWRRSRKPLDTAGTAASGLPWPRRSGWEQHQEALALWRNNLQTSNVGLTPLFPQRPKTGDATADVEKTWATWAANSQRQR